MNIITQKPRRKFRGGRRLIRREIMSAGTDSLASEAAGLNDGEQVVGDGAAALGLVQ